MVGDASRRDTKQINVILFKCRIAKCTRSISSCSCSHVGRHMPSKQLPHLKRECNSFAEKIESTALHSQRSNWFANRNNHGFRTRLQCGAHTSWSRTNVMKPTNMPFTILREKIPGIFVSSSNRYPQSIWAFRWEISAVAFCILHIGSIFIVSVILFSRHSIIAIGFERGAYCTSISFSTPSTHKRCQEPALNRRMLLGRPMYITNGSNGPVPIEKKMARKR